MLPHANILDLKNNKNAVKFFLTSLLVSPTIKRVKCEVGWGPEISEAGLKTSAQIQVISISVPLRFLFWQPTSGKAVPLPYAWEVTILAYKYGNSLSSLEG